MKISEKPQPESFLSVDETVDAFTAHGFIILTGHDAKDGRGVALEVTTADARALAAWLVATADQMSAK